MFHNQFSGLSPAYRDATRNSVFANPIQSFSFPLQWLRFFLFASLVPLHITATSAFSKRARGFLIANVPPGTPPQFRKEYVSSVLSFLLCLRSALPLRLNAMSEFPGRILSLQFQSYHPREGKHIQMRMRYAFLRLNRTEKFSQGGEHHFHLAEN